MKKIFASIYLIFNVLTFGLTQHDSSHVELSDSSIVETLELQDSTKKHLDVILNDFYARGDSGSHNLAIINVPPSASPQKDNFEFLKEGVFTWSQFFLTAFVLLLLYFLFQFFNKILDKYNFLGKYQSDIKSFIKYTLLIYEALVLLVLGSAFILIYPVFHGILAAIILATGFTHVRNYFSGRVVQFDRTIEKGKRLKTNGSQGVIFNVGRLGLKLRTNKGVQFINYTKLVSDGYMLLSGVEVGGFYKLEIQPKEWEEKKDYHVHLQDLLTTVPYLDWNHKPQLEPILDESKVIIARVEVKEESHLFDLVTLIKEWNYSCKVIS